MSDVGSGSTAEWILIILLLCLIYFYRYPKKILRGMDEKFVFSPAYGTIYDIQRNSRDNTLFIAIFLSPLDIHYQFTPISGVVEQVQYDYNGNFELAYDLNKSRNNEKVITSISNSRGVFKVYQIAGFLVRRISNDLHENQKVESGTDLGLIHFGSRVDLIIPNASSFNLLARVGQTVNGSHSIIGYY
jgi:phosphatidylserine decarboxylase